METKEFNAFKETEKWLYNYKGIKASIENLKKLYIEKEKEVEEGHAISYEKDKLCQSYKFNSETEDIALDLAVIVSRIERMETKLNVMDMALLQLETVERKVIELKYFQGNKWWQIGFLMKYDESWCRAIRNRAITKLSIAMFGDI